MSALSSERMLKLMAYADGELEGAERAEVEKLLASDIDAVRFVNEMAGLGELVQTGRTDAPISKVVATFDIADLVMSKIHTPASAGGPESVGEEEKPKVVSLSEAREARERKAPIAIPAKKAAPSNRNLKVGAAVAAALALAASVFLMTRPKEAPLANAPKANPTQMTASQDPAPANGMQNGIGVEVDAVESPGVSVFYLPGTNQAGSPATSVVVWVEEAAGEKKK